MEAELFRLHRRVSVGSGASSGVGSSAVGIRSASGGIGRGGSGIASSFSGGNRSGVGSVAGGVGGFGRGFGGFGGGVFRLRAGRESESANHGGSENDLAHVW